MTVSWTGTGTGTLLHIVFRWRQHQRSKKDGATEVRCLQRGPERAIKNKIYRQQHPLRSLLPPSEGLNEINFIPFVLVEQRSSHRDRTRSPSLWLCDLRTASLSKKTLFKRYISSPLNNPGFVLGVALIGAPGCRGCNFVAIREPVATVGLIALYANVLPTVRTMRIEPYFN